MSQPCAATKCERVSRAPCDCCKRNLCLQHLNEHNASLVSQLNPLTDEINVLGDRLRTFDLNETTTDCRQKLEQWRLNCHQEIDQIVERKCQELDRLVAAKLDKQQKEFFHIQSKVAKLIREQEATQQDIDTLTRTIRQFEEEMSEIEQTCFRISTRPLLIDDSIVQVQDMYALKLNSSTLSSVHGTIKHLPGSFHSMASNDQVLLIHQIPNLCFLNAELKIIKQVLWPHDTIRDMCWSSTLNRFIVIGKNGLFLVDENTLSIERVQTVEKPNWCYSACSNNQLFVSTVARGSSIVKIRLSPSIDVIKEWKSPTTCTKDECINDIAYNNGILTVVIRNKIEKSFRIELRSDKTLNCIWSLPLDTADNETFALRCCSLSCNEGLVADYHARRLLHITADGKIKTKLPYNAIPYRVAIFNMNILVVSTENEINFHKL